MNEQPGPDARPVDETTTGAAMPDVALPAAPPPPAAPQPAVQWQAPPPPAVARPGQRTTLAAVAGVILVVLGVLGGLIGVVILGGAALFADLVEGSVGTVPGLPEGMTIEEFVGGVVGIVGSLVIAFSVAYVLGGIGVLRTAGWGRVIGITVAVISGLVWAGGLSGRDGFGFAMVMFLLHAYVFFALVFRWREPATA